MIAAGLSFTLMVSLVKVDRIELSTLEVIFWRGAGAVPLAFLLARRGGLRVRNRRLLTARVTIGFVATFCYFAAASFSMPVWAVIADIVIFATIPGTAASIGGVLIVGSGMWLVFGTLSHGPKTVSIPDEPRPPIMPL